MLATLAPVIAVEDFARGGPLVAYEAPVVDLAGRDLEEADFPFLLAVLIVIAVVSLAAMVTDSGFRSNLDAGPIEWYVEVY